jgi:hypothetical protein
MVFNIDCKISARIKFYHFFIVQSKATTFACHKLPFK